MTDTTEGKVTLAVIGTKLDIVIENQKRQEEQQNELQSCVDKMAHIPEEVETLKKTVLAHGEAIVALKSRTDNIGVFNGLLSVIAGAVGSLFNPKM